LYGIPKRPAKVIPTTVFLDVVKDQPLCFRDGGTGDPVSERLNNSRPVPGHIPLSKLTLYGNIGKGKVFRRSCLSSLVKLKGKRYDELNTIRGKVELTSPKRAVAPWMQ